MSGSRRLRQCLGDCLLSPETEAPVPQFAFQLEQEKHLPQAPKEECRGGQGCRNKELCIRCGGELPEGKIALSQASQQGEEGLGRDAQAGTRCYCSYGSHQELVSQILDLANGEVSGWPEEFLGLGGTLSASFSLALLQFECANSGGPDECGAAE